MVAVGLAYAGHLLVANIVQLSFLRAFLGFARGGVLPALYALTSLYAPPERRGGMMAIASSLTVLGNMLGPVIGGVVAGHFGILAVFVVNCVLLLATGGVLWKYLEDDPPVRATFEGRATDPAPSAVPNARSTDSPEVLS